MTAFQSAYRKHHSTKSTLLNIHNDIQPFQLQTQPIQLQTHLDEAGLMTAFQSAYRKHHSIKRALLNIHNDIQPFQLQTQPIQLQTHLNEAGLMTAFQSAYRKHHSTKSALLNIHNDIQPLSSWISQPHLTPLTTPFIPTPIPGTQGKVPLNSSSFTPPLSTARFVNQSNFSPIPSVTMPQFSGTPSPSK